MRWRSTAVVLAGLWLLGSSSCAPAEDALGRNEAGDAADARSVLERHLELGAAGDLEGAMALLADDARWSFNGLEIVLGAPIPSDAVWLTRALDVPAGAGSHDLVAGMLWTLAVRRAQPTLTDCVAAESAINCVYAAPDAFSEVFGFVERGTVRATVEASRIAGLVLTTDDRPGGASPDFDAFRRWSAVHSAGEEPPRSFIEALGDEVGDVEAWTEAGRPDVGLPPTGSGPVDRVLAWLDARNGRDFVAMVGLMAGEALDSEVGSWAEFEAARLLDRVIHARACEVTAEGDRLGSFVACDVEVIDIIVGTAGTTSTNLNQSTFRVRNGRIVALPEYFPSSHVAESAIEQWAQDAEPEAYAEACPDGIAGQSPVDGLPCARFIVEHAGRWGPIVANLGLGD